MTAHRVSVMPYAAVVDGWVVQCSAGDLNEQYPTEAEAQARAAEHEAETS